MDFDLTINSKRRYENFMKRVLVRVSKTFGD
jgi:hypothetical protein